MKVFVAIDSFKGAVGSAAACRAAADALREAFALREAGGRLSAPAGSGRSAASPADVREFPVSDGGEGFCECIHHYLGGTWIPLPVTGPDGRTVEAKYLIANGKAPANGSIFGTGGTAGTGNTSGTGDASPKTAFIESASACGYTLVSGSSLDPHERDTDSPDRPDPREMTTAGVGELIADAVSRGCTRIILGLGGTATMDAGLGLYNALRKAFPAAPDPNHCATLGDIEFTVCVDTFAPLTGPAGAAYMYGPQKGLRKDQLAEADAWLSRQASRLGLSPVSASTTANHCTSAPLASTASAFATPTRFTTSTPGFGAAGGLLCGLTAALSLAAFSPDFVPTPSPDTRGSHIFDHFCDQHHPESEGTGPTLKIVSGAEYLIEISGLKEAIRETGKDNILIITGEGRVDEQSLTGKLTGRIASLASSLNQDNNQGNKQENSHPVNHALNQGSTQPTNQSSPLHSTLPRSKVLCLAGSIGEGLDPKNSIFDEVLIITPEGTPLDKALAGTATNIRRTLLDYFSSK
ncbi:MAG: glycerate kinase [Bacteroidia bacterium]|nr:glycerate kinase [Bacteroidia bacterium]